MQTYVYDITDKNATFNITSPLLKHKLMFFDIETDGLSHKNRILIIGMMIHDPIQHITQLIQLFNDDYHSEFEMLQYFHDAILSHSPEYYVTFNGNSFDIPFINARFSHHHISLALIKSANIDLLRIAKQNQDLLKLDNYKLKTLETYVGISRDDTISGKDSIILYQAYIETKSNQIKDTILLHNYDDILNMLPLLNITNHIDDVNPFSFYIGNPLDLPQNKLKCYLSSYQFKTNQCVCSFEFYKNASLLELQYHTQTVSFETTPTHGHVKFSTITIHDANGNEYMFVDPSTLNYNSFNDLSDNEKQSLLIRYNHEFYRKSFFSNISRICNHIHTLINN